MSVEEIKNAREQLKQDNAKLQNERNTNVKIMKSLIEGLSKTTLDLELANVQIRSSVDTLDRLKLSKFLNRWMILGSFISIFVFASLLTLGLVKLLDSPQHTGSLNQNLVRMKNSNLLPLSVGDHR